MGDRRDFDLSNCSGAWYCRLRGEKTFCRNHTEPQVGMTPYLLDCSLMVCQSYSSHVVLADDFENIKDFGMMMPGFGYTNQPRGGSRVDLWEGHAHPHPACSPDGQQVVFTRDCNGHAQINVTKVLWGTA